MQEPFDIPTALAVIRRRGWIVLLSVLVALVAASAVTSSQARRFRATATLFVRGVAPAVHSASVDPSSTSLELATLAQNTSQAYAELVNSQAIAGDAAARLSVPVASVLGHIQGEAQPGVQLIRVQADGPTAAYSARLANAAAAALATRAPGRASNNSGGLRLEIVDPAHMPAQPVSPRITLNLALGGLAGLLLGLALATVRERIDRRIRSSADAGEALGLPVLAELPRIARALRRKSATDRHTIHRIADPYRSLATTIMVASEKAAHRRLLITSAVPKEGKSTVAAHLALSLAQDGEQTVLLDCDLHRPSQHRAFPKASRAPLGDVLRTTNGSLADSTEVLPRLKVLAATEADTNGMLSVRSPEFVNAIEAASAEQAHVVLDCPPVLGSSDAGALARSSDAAILVIAAGRTREDDAVAALAALNRTGIAVLGVVLFGERPRRRSSYYYRATR